MGRGSRGTRDEDLAWRQLKERLARALISDPDLYFYFAYLSSNKARGLAIELSEALAEMVTNAEGRRLPQKEIPSSAVKRISQDSNSLVEVLRRRGTPSDKSIQQLRDEVDTFSKKYLLKNVKSGDRVQKRGSEASAEYAKAKQVIIDKWHRMFSYLFSLLKPSPIPMDLVQPEALKAPAVALQTTAALEYPPAQATDYTLQMLASMSGVEAMGREVDSFYRMQISEETTFPAGVSVQPTGSPISSFSIHNKGGRVNPKTLGIKAGDKVKWLQHEAEVTGVSSTEVLISGSIPSGARALMSVESGPGVLYREARTRVDVVSDLIPTTVRIRRQMEALEGTSAPKTSKLAQFLAESAALLHPLDSETSLALERMGVSVSVDDTLSDALLAYSPVFKSSTRQAAMDVLDIMRNDGFSYAENLLMRCEFSDLFLIDSSMASFSSRFGEAAASFTEALGRERPPNLTGR